MDYKIKWLMYLTGILLIASACNLVTRVFSPVDEVVSEIEELAEEVEIEDIEREIESLATELPSELPDIGDIGDIEDLQETAQAFQEGFDTGELPPDIPVVDEPVEIVLSSEEFLSYTTPLEFETVLTFYQEKMIEYGWEPNEDEPMIMGEMAVLQFNRPDREAVISLGTNPQDGTTFVMVNVQSK
jgi:hypothetical protein